MESQVKSNKKQEEIDELQKAISKQKKKMQRFHGEKKQLSDKIKRQERELEDKINELAEVKEALDEMKRRNAELKEKLDEQFQNFQKICEETMGRYKIFDDLIKRDKVQVQLLEIQNKKILGKDKVI